MATKKSKIKKTTKKTVTKKAPPKKKAAIKGRMAKKRGDEPRVTRKEAVQAIIADQPNRMAAIRALMGELNAPDHKVMAFADEAPTTYKLRRPFGIMQLDIDTGGGPTAGGLSLLTGPDNAGKTYLMYLLMAFHQKLYGDDASMFFATAEGGFDIAAARLFGVRVAYPDDMIEEWAENRSLLNLPPFTNEELHWLKDQVGIVTVIEGDTGEEIMDTILSCVASKLFHIGFIDSFSALRPEADASKELGETDMRAARASLETRFMKHYMPLTSTLNGRNFTTLIGSQQVRANQDRANAPAYMQSRIKKWQATGAWAIRHGKVLDVCVSSGEKIKREVNKDKHVAGKIIKWELIKGKAGTHDNITGEAQFFYKEFGNGVNLHESVIMAGLQHGVIYETEKGQVRMNTATGNPITIAPSLALLPRLMHADFEFELAIRREILAERGITCLYR